MTKNKKQKQKQKQKQSQVQNVVVNVGYKRRSSNKEKSQQQSVVSKQAIPQQQALPYLGLQSANNAQLLNSLQASLTALYSQHNKQQQLLTAPPLPATQGFQRPKMVPPSEAPPTLLPPPPPTTPKRNSTLSQKPAPPPPQTSYNATQKSVTFSSNAPPTSTPIAETVATRRNWTKSDFDLDTNKDGTVRKKGDKWRMLTEEQKQDIKDEELRNRPVRATRIKGQPNDFVTDDEAMDENRAVVALSKYKPFSSTSMPSEPPAQRPQKSVLDFFSPPAFRHSKIAPTEVASEPVRKPPADNGMLKQRFTSGRILSTGDETDTDYGNNISETLFE